MPEYRIKKCRKTSTDKSSCEVCGKESDPLYKHQSRGRDRSGWYDYQRGHAECLKTSTWQYAPVVE